MKEVGGGGRGRGINGMLWYLLCCKLISICCLANSMVSKIALDKNDVFAVNFE